MSKAVKPAPQKAEPTPKPEAVKPAPQKAEPTPKPEAVKPAPQKAEPTPKPEAVKPAPQKAEPTPKPEAVKPAPQKAEPTVEDTGDTGATEPEVQTPTPTVETTTFKEEFIDAPGSKVATVTTNPTADVLHSSANSNKVEFIHNLVTNLVIKISHQAAIDLIKSEPSKYVLATDDQIAEYKSHNDGEGN